LVALSLHRLPLPAPALAPPRSLLSGLALHSSNVLKTLCITLPLSFFALPCMSVVFVPLSSVFETSSPQFLTFSNITRIQAHKLFEAPQHF
jgi:hypothetical protein